MMTLPPLAIPARYQQAVPPMAYGVLPPGGSPPDTFIRNASVSPASMPYSAPLPPISAPPAGLQDTASLQRYYFQLGEQYYQNNRFRHAINAFTQAIQLNPSDAVAYNKRGVAKVGVKDPQGAFDDYSQAIALRPDFYNAYINRGNLWVYLGDGSRQLGQFSQSDQQYQMALKDYNQAIRLNPMNGVAYENRGELYGNLGMRPQSLQDKAMVIRLQALKPHTSMEALGLRNCPPRVALVMANDDYAGTENDLNGGPIHDAESMALMLEKQGFMVMRGYNLTGTQTKAKVSEFTTRLHENPGAVSLVYYSGHGGSINGNNYLIPTNFTGSIDPNFTQDAVSVDYLLKQLKYANSYFNMIFLDACRTPLLENTAFKSGQPVVKQWETEPGPGLSNTWIEYASRPKMPALQNRNEGLYTKYLLRYMGRPDMNLKEVSMNTSFALETDPVAQRENQHARTQTDLSRTEPIAQAFSFARHCGNPLPHVTPAG